MAIKVKQSTIDEIKKMGMTKALASAKTRRSPEFQEALRRMYGQRRLDAAMKGAQGGSASRETYMKRGYSSRPTSGGKSAPVKKGGGQGYAGSPKSQKQTRNRRGAAGVLGAAGAAGAAAMGAKQAKNTKAGVKASQSVLKAGGGYKSTKAAKAAQAAVGKSRFPQVASAGFRAIPLVGTTLTAAQLAYMGGKKASEQAKKAGRKVQAAGSGRTSSMAASIKSNRKLKRKTGK